MGDTKTTKVALRVIAATSRALNKDIPNGKFRGVQFYPFNVYHIHIPPLRERREDIKILVEYFVNKFRERFNPRVKGVSDGVMSELYDYPWYGNVRELENIIERAVILTDTDIIKSVDLVSRVLTEEKDFIIDSLSLDQAWQGLEKRYIDKALSNARGNRTKAARLLGLSRRALLYKLKQYGLNKE